MKHFLPIAAVAVLALSACSAAPDAPDDDRIQIVASTSVYGDLATSIGGDLVSVTSIIDSPAHDPHSYEASAQDQLALSRADLVIFNGGGYDPFIEQLLDAAGTTPAIVEAVEVSGLLPGHEHDHADHDHGDDEHSEEDHAHGDDEHSEEDHAHGEDDHDHGKEDHAESEEADDHTGHNHIEGFNEHVWYDVHAVAHIVEAIAHELAELAPEHTAELAANAETLAAAVDVVHDRLHELEHDLGGGTVAVTEPVATYLLTGLGFTDATPAAFAEAIEEGADVPPAALLSILNLIDSGDLALLAYNEQTSSPETERVLAAAEDAGVPVVSFAETLPVGADYVSWMTDNLDRLEAALLP